MDAMHPIDAALRRRLIEALAAAVIDHTDELTELDRAIGDGDHGLNLKRGFEAVLAEIDSLGQQPLPQALVALGTTLIMKVGGASGPLYGTLFRTLGRELPPDPSPADAARALAAALEAMKKLGRSDVGQKTMLDVLAPAQEELAAGGEELRARVRRRAADAADATIAMRAIKGRASFLGERSVGHMDPGARSSSLMIAAICEVLEG
ncbi:MAG TPA: dihydroxyacetone kinase subunit DhaL [Kofleriaceae bacterium]|nr:dihydroxyacetone kinase subunit DhaL [Kofleriaceae bacterium]